MLRTFATRSLVLCRAPQTISTRYHSKESGLYEKEQEIKQRIIELQKENKPVPHERDAKAVALVKETYQAIENSASLSSLNIDPRACEDSSAKHATTKRVVY